MDPSLPEVLGGSQRGIAASYLVTYMESQGDWPASVTFSRDKFWQWLINDSSAAGAFGCDYVMSGFDELTDNGFIIQSGDCGEMTPEFAQTMREHYCY